jgi:hypothetical protein
VILLPSIMFNQYYLHFLSVSFVCVIRVIFSSVKSVLSVSFLCVIYVISSSVKSVL